MRNRIPTELAANGALRYGVYDKAGNLLRHEYLKPDDAPIDPGTVLAKETLLQDETAMLFGLEEDAVPDDALRNAYHRTPQVGDIKATMRTDLGDDWRLCNGDFFSESELPALAAISPAQQSLLNLSRILYSSPNGAYYNDTSSFDISPDCQVSAYAYQRNDYFGINLAVSTDEFASCNVYAPCDTSGALLFKEVYASSPSVLVRYVGDRWVLVIAHNDAYNATVHYSTDPTNPNSWTSAGKAGYFSALFDAWVGQDGRAYIAGVGNTSTSNNTYYVMISHADDFAGTSSWSKKLASSVQMGVSNFARNGDECAFIASMMNTTPTQYRVYHTPDISTLTWTYVVRNIKNTSDGFSWHTSGGDFGYYNGVWAIPGLAWGGSGSDYYLAIAWTEDITAANWTISLTKKLQFETHNDRLRTIIPCRGGYLCPSYYLYAPGASDWVFAPSITDGQTWEIFSVTGMTGSGSLEARDMSYHRPVVTDKQIYAPGPGGSVVGIPIYAVPLLPADNHYNYIKVK